MTQFKPRHRLSDTRIHRCWMSMRGRCERRTDGAYANYGGRGIEVCDRWQVFENFLADMGPMPDGMEIERIDVNGNYEPSNCRWATPYEQNRNRRNNRMIEYQGRIQCLTDWAIELGLKKECLHYRIVKKKLPPEVAFFMPVMTAQEAAKLGGDTRWGHR